MHRVISTRTLVTLLSAAFGILIGLVSFSENVSASSVSKVRGKQAIVVFDGGETPAPGDKFFALEGGKRKAVLEVVQFKNGKAKVKILKGTAKEGMDVASTKRKAKTTQTAQSDENSEASDDDENSDDDETKTTSKNKPLRNAGKATLFKDMTIGAVVGYAMDSQTVSISGQSIAMTGSGFSAKGFADIPIAGSLSLLPRAGAEQFNVQNGNSKTSILYAVGDLILKYAFADSGFIPFGLAGLGIHFPLSKSSELALDVNRISSTTVFYAGGGFNYAISGSSYFQLTAEYGYFPPSNDVTTSMIAVRSGLGFRF